MIKLIVLMRRKPGLSVAAFRRHYEELHAPLALKLLGHLMSGYRRNYPRAEYGHLSEPTEAGTGPTFDVVTEIDLRDAEALDEMQRVMAQPEVRSAIIADEQSFIDRASVRILVCQEERSLLSGERLS